MTVTPSREAIGMTAAQLRKLCMSLPGTTETIQWGDNRVFKIGGKMYAVFGSEKDSRCSFKVDDERFLELTDLAGVVPAPYLARARWVQVNPAECELAKTELTRLVRHSYDLVFAKLSKKAQRAISESIDLPQWWRTRAIWSRPRQKEKRLQQMRRRSIASPVWAGADGDGVVNPIDLGIFRSVFFSADPDADINGDGVVNPVDLGLFRAIFFGPPGPSGLIP